MGKHRVYALWTSRHYLCCIRNEFGCCITTNGLIIHGGADNALFFLVMLTAQSHFICGKRKLWLDTFHWRLHLRFFLSFIFSLSILCSLFLSISFSFFLSHIIYHNPWYLHNTGELGYDGLNGTRKIGLSYAKSKIHMANTWYASAWDQAYRPSYAKICRTVVRHIQVHLYL